LPIYNHMVVDTSTGRRRFVARPPLIRRPPIQPCRIRGSCAMNART
jgi:hypothetical protein